MLEKFCSVSNIVDTDDFVGVRIHDGKPEVRFPLGFSLSNNDDQIRRDIIHLLSVLRDFTSLCSLCDLSGFLHLCKHKLSLFPGDYSSASLSGSLCRCSKSSAGSAPQGLTFIY